MQKKKLKIWKMNKKIIILINNFIIIIKRQMLKVIPNLNNSSIKNNKNNKTIWKSKKKDKMPEILMTFKKIFMTKIITKKFKILTAFKILINLLFQAIIKTNNNIKKKKN